MAGIYQNFAELAIYEEESVDYRIRFRKKPAKYAIIAPHGGGIEHGTGLIADAIAGEEHAYYCFEGLKDRSHALHISSKRFDEPHALSIARMVDTIITIHGAYGKMPGVYFGGLNQALKATMIKNLQKKNFAAELDPSPTRQGKHVMNICNRGKQGKGVQIEMTQGFRKSLFHKPNYKNTRWTPNEHFYQFVSTIRHVLQKTHLAGDA